MERGAFGFVIKRSRPGWCRDLKEAKERRRKSCRAYSRVHEGKKEKEEVWLSKELQRSLSTDSMLTHESQDGALCGAMRNKTTIETTVMISTPKITQKENESKPEDTERKVTEMFMHS